MKKAKRERAIRGTILVALAMSCVHAPASATAELDQGAAVGSRTAAPDTVSEQNAFANHGGPTKNGASDIFQSNTAPDLVLIDAPILTPGEVLYSVRLPLSVSGSRLPTMSTGAPVQTPPHVFLPSPASSEIVHPLSWRTTAEAIRNQAAGKSLIVCSFPADFQNTAQTLIREAEESGYRLGSMSLRAGHLLFKVPRESVASEGERKLAEATNDTWLIVTLSPLETGSTEMRMKIQSRSPASVAPQINAFVQRAQNRAAGKNLL